MPPRPCEVNHVPILIVEVCGQPLLVASTDQDDPGSAVFNADIVVSHKLMVEAKFTA
jgi:hypothetical protein